MGNNLVDETVMSEHTSTDSTSMDDDVSMGDDAGSK